MLEFIEPDWQVADRIKAFVTTRQGGTSLSPFDSLNLATHVGDDPERVKSNRKRLSEDLHLPNEPNWLEQVHGIHVFKAEQQNGISADAAYSDQPGEVCVVLTADCLPVFLASEDGSEVAVAHAGWKGLLAGVIENTVKQFQANPENIHAWLGPAIGPEAFEVGAEVRSLFLRAALASEQQATAGSFSPQPLGGLPKWRADIYALAKIRLNRKGVNRVGGGQFCTVNQPERFYSYRRDGQTGRMASLVWIEKPV